MLEAVNTLLVISRSFSIRFGVFLFEVFFGGFFFLNKDATGQKSKDQKSHINRDVKEVFYCLFNFLKGNTTSVVSFCYKVSIYKEN